MLFCYVNISNKVFDHAAPFYNNALKTSGYKANISYKEAQNNNNNNNNNNNKKVHQDRVILVGIIPPIQHEHKSKHCKGVPHYPR